MRDYKCFAEADILSKYKDVFPTEFIDAVRKGVSWLCTHNNITYQTSIMVASDRVLYNTAGSSVLRIGLINIHAPLTGLTYYEVKSISIASDEVSGNIVFTVKMKYDTPMGITVSLVPITYFNQDEGPDVYSKYEVDAIIRNIEYKLTTKADAKSISCALDTITENIEECAKLDTVNSLGGSIHSMAEQLSKIDIDADFIVEVKDRLNGVEETVYTLNNVVDEIATTGGTSITDIDLSQYAKKEDIKDWVVKDDILDFVTGTQIENMVTKDDILNFVTKEQLDEQIAQAQLEGKDVDLSAYLKTNDADTLYLRINDIANHPELKGEKGEPGEKGDKGEPGEKGEKGEPGANGGTGDNTELLKEIEELKERLSKLEQGQPVQPTQPTVDPNNKIVTQSTVKSVPGKLNVVEVEVPEDHELEATVKSGKGDIHVG